MTNREFTTLRSELKMSLRGCAQALGVEPSTISRWESGATPIPKMAELALQALRPAPATSAPAVGDWRAANRAKYADQEWLVNADAAKYLGVHRRTLLDWVKAGFLPEPVVGIRHDGHQDRKIRSHRRADLDAFLAKDAQRMGRRQLR